MIKVEKQRVSDDIWEI